MKKQTAIEFLLEKMNNNFLRKYYAKEIEQAKELEKQQIMDSNKIGVNCGLYNYRNAEEYYNKTFKK